MSLCDLNDEVEFRNKVTIITFLCSILVIWIHARNLEVYAIDETAVGFGKIVFDIEDIWGNLTVVAVPIFFFVSGYLFYRTFSIQRINEKYKSRVFSILVPYLIWCTIYYLYYFVLTNTPILSNVVNTEKVTLSLMGWLEALWPNEYYTLWFLKEIIIYIVASPIIFLLLNNKYTGSIIILLLVMNAQFGIFSVPLAGYAYYAFGAYFALNFKGKEFVKNNCLTVVGIFSILVMLCTRFTILESPIIRLLFVFMLWFALDIFPLRRELPWWMKITFFTYVSHDIFLEAYEKIVLVVFGKHVIFALLDYIFAPLLVVATLIIIAKFLRRFAPTVWKVCTGNR